MKTKSLAELQREAQKYFEKYGVNKLYATTDGQIFLLESRAILHAGKGKVHTIEKEEEVAETSEAQKRLTAKEITAFLAVATDVEVVRQMLNDEVGSANRKSVVSAIEKRLEELANEQ